MRRVAVYLTVIAVMAISLVAGWMASDWPRWCLSLHWCQAGFPH